MTPHQPPPPGSPLHALLAAMVGDDGADLACGLALIGWGLWWLPLTMLGWAGVRWMGREARRVAWRRA